MSQMTCIAAEINRQHALATEHAQTAIEHAKRAGDLLLEVKASLPHGEFLPWIAGNITVTARQAQRYMRAAQGKALPVRGIAALPKCDSVSYLPASGQTAIATLATYADGEDWIEIEEVGHAPGFFHVLAIVGSSANYSKRGIRADWVNEFLRDVLPGHYTRESLDALDWQYFEPAHQEGVGGGLAGLTKQWRDEDRLGEAR